jgi:hypothetical protein
MADVQIFISYARFDDELPPDMPNGRGFVTYLHEQLKYEFNQLGDPKPTIWRDTKRIEKADAFDSRLEEAIDTSAIFLIVLSSNWMARPYCRWELERFAKRWGDAPGLRERIFIVGKRHVDKDRRPSLLQNQEGFLFYSLDDHEENGIEREFFARGQVRDRERYEKLVEQLAGNLSRRAKQLIKRDLPPRSLAQPNGRSIYVAKPAGDMRQGYERVVKELTGRGYQVVPEMHVDIPPDASATSFIDAALAKAELSVHLLGEKPGFVPDDHEQGIVKLQLLRAAARVPTVNPNSDEDSNFRRIIWGPRVFERVAPAPVSSIERNPLEALAKFDKQLDSDKIDGNDLSRFVDFLTQHLTRIPRVEVPPPAPLKGDARIYLYHRLDDTDYAVKLSAALVNHRVETVFPVLEGTPAELDDSHRKQLAECDAVVLCWAAASEAWVMAQAAELRDWHKFGRSERFAYRGLVAGPPPGLRKKFRINTPPRSQIDLVLNLTDFELPPPEKLDQLVQMTSEARSNGP